MGTALHALVVRGSPTDAGRIASSLRRDGYEPLLERVETEAQFLAALEQPGWDVVLVHSTIPHVCLVRIIQLLRERDLDPPVVVISSGGDEEEVVSAMKAGAHECVPRSNLGRLPGVVEKELREATARQCRREAERERGDADVRYRGLTEEIPALT